MIENAMQNRKIDQTTVFLLVQIVIPLGAGFHHTFGYRFWQKNSICIWIWVLAEKSHMHLDMGSGRKIAYAFGYGFSRICKV